VKRYLATSALTVALTLGLLAGYHALADEDQPHMRMAMHHLEEAKKELEMAAHDKGGHREKALDLTQSAIQEVRAGMEFAEHHDKK
jgi:hypothetical protein